MDKPQTKSNKPQSYKNILESLKDIGSSTASSAAKDIIKPQDFMEQLLGMKPQSYTGEISPGEAVEMKEVFTGQREENERLKKQMALERKLREEEKARNEEKAKELQLQLQVIIREVASLSKSTQGLAQEVEIAAMQAPIEPGVYHVIFFEKLLEFIKSFRKKINDASNWLQAVNTRAQKKNYWARYKKHGGKFLLSGEHYLTRSAG